MKRLAAFLLFLLAGTMVPAGIVGAEQQLVTTFQVTAGKTWTKEIPGAIVNWTGTFDYSKRDGWEAAFSVYFTETGNTHGVAATENGFVDADGKYIWFLKNVQTEDNPETRELGVLESWHELVVKFIDPLSGKVVIDNDYNGETYTLYVGDEIDISGELADAWREKTILELRSIETSLFGSKAVLILHHITAVSGTVEIYPYQEQTSEPNSPNENQTNETTPQKPLIDPAKVPAVMIVVGEHAAGADVAAGAKVGIAVQKWIDIIKEKGAEFAIPGLGHLGGLIAKAVTAPVQNLNADAMLDSEVKDPDRIAPIVYTVGGPVANEYTKLILEKNADRLPVKFIKENGKWYIKDRKGNKWDNGYGIILIIPASENPAELQIRLMNGKIKMADVVVAGTDRVGTYAACELLQGEFLKPLLGEKPKPELEYFLQLQGRMLLLFGQNPLEAFDVNLDPTNPFKFQVTAVIVDKDGRIVKVIVG